MSSASLKAYANLTGARRTVQRMRDGLRLIAGGAVASEAAQEIGAAYDRIVNEKYRQHMATGALVADANVNVAEDMITITRYAYARFHAWDPLRRGSVPPFMLKIAAQILSAKLLAAVRADSGFVRTPAAIGLDEAEGIERAGIAEASKRAGRAAAKEQARNLRALAKQSRAKAPRKSAKERLLAAGQKRIAAIRARTLGKKG